MDDWNEFVRRYRRLGLWEANRRLIPNKAIREPYVDAEDVVQEAYLKMLEAGYAPEDGGCKALMMQFLRGSLSNWNYKNQFFDIRAGTVKGGRPSQGSTPKVFKGFAVQCFGTMLSDVQMTEAPSPSGSLVE